MKKHTFKQGFTLVELLIFMAMFSVILVVLTNLFSAIVEKQLEIESVSAVESDSKFIINRFMYDISRADSITAPATLGAESDTLTLNINGVTFSYTLAGENLQITEGAQTNVLNSVGTTISDLTFTRLGNNTTNGKHTIEVAYTVTSTTILTGEPETKTVRTLIGLR